MEIYMKKYIEKHNLFLDKAAKRQREEKPEIKSQTEDLITFEDKIELAEKVRRAPVEQLAEIVRMVEIECKNAIEELDAERIQVKMNALDRSTFDRIWR